MAVDESTVSFKGRKVTNLRFADDTDGLAGYVLKLKNLVQLVNQSSTKLKMKISAN